MHWFAQIGGDSLPLTGMLGLSSACFDNDCVTCVWNSLSLFVTSRELPRLMYLMRWISKTAFQPVAERICERSDTSNLSEVINYKAESDMYRDSSFVIQGILYDLCC